MRSIWRTLDRGLVRDIVLVCLADGVVGLSYGAITTGSGFGIWLPVVLSVVVFAGASQFLFIGVLAAGGSPFAAMAAGLLVNARHLPFGLAIGGVLDGGGFRGRLRRVLGAHVMIDESVAFSIAQRDPVRRRGAYWLCGLGIFVTWNLGCLAGAFLGDVVGDPDTFGLDAAFPAVLFSLVLPSLKDKPVLRAVAIGVVLALAVTPFLPPGVPVLVALAGVLAVVGTPAAKDAKDAKNEVLG